MAIMLPEGYPNRSSSPRHDAYRSAREGGERPLRVGIINIMPRIEDYEPLLLGPLSRARSAVEPVFVRLESHAYQSSDQEHLARFYTPFSRVIAQAPLDGLILTGAPVEELPFEEVRYWSELSSILSYARTHITSTLGLCWGGMALGKLLGVEKQRFARKLFGVFEDRLLVPSHELVRADQTRGAFVCAHSRHSGIVEAALAEAEQAGRVQVLSRGAKTGSTMFESTDRRYVAHLGHPEYEGDRLAFEWKRDRSLGRDDVSPPESFDASSPTTPWRTHREGIFAAFVERVRQARELADASVTQLHVD